ncbi:MAG: SpoIIE family protein phosphatase [Crocinitomicaceae bacterium]|nr:SpoIIE family protein phosphatase [Crocinitomicaceae bacterium]
MRYLILNIVLFLVFLLSPNHTFTQEFSDSTWAVHYFKVFREYEYSDSSKARIYADSSIFYAYASGINDLKGRAHQFRGWYYQDRSRFKDANKEFYASLTFLKACGNEQGVADAYGNLGNSYLDMEEYHKSLDYQVLSLEANKTILATNPTGETKTWAEEGNTIALHNIAAIYQKIELYDEALKYELESMEFELQSGNEFGVAISYNTIGQIYKSKQFTDSAVFYFEKALEIYSRIDYPYGLAASLQMYATLEGTDLTQEKKKEMLEEAIALRRAMGDAYGETAALLEIGNSQFDLLSNDSLSALVESIYFLIEDNELESLNEKYFRLYSRYNSRIGEYASAYFALENFLELKAISDEKKLTRDLIARDITHQLELEQEIERMEASERLSKVQNVVYLSIAGFIVLIVLLIFIINANRRRRRMNDVLVDTNKTIQEQKTQVEEKSKAISDSINYAKRLQTAILPTAGQVNEHLPDSFLFFKPKDVVSGDFHWFESKGDLIFIAAADCTGHGIPGAMVSVVCSNALNRAVNMFGLTEPARILDKAREYVIETFAKSGGDVSDGMDISLCAIQGNTLTFSGANNPLWVVRKNKFIADDAEKIERGDEVSLIEIKGDKQPVGHYSGVEPFTQHELELQTSDMVYLFTDGYADQFGGPKGKKFKYAPFKRALISMNGLEMSEQGDYLDKVFDAWKGDLEQVDDVCVIGFKCG